MFASDQICADNAIIYARRLGSTVRAALARLDMVLIDVNGGVHRGHMTRGANPVPICLELFLEVIDRKDGSRKRRAPCPEI